MQIIRERDYSLILHEVCRRDYEEDRSRLFDLRGSCQDQDFPNNPAAFAFILGNTMNLRCFKNSGDCHWRLHWDRRGMSSLYLKVRDGDSGLTFKFKVPHKNLHHILTGTVKQAIEYMASEEAYAGAFPGERMEIHYATIDRGIFQPKSTIEMLEEINQRYKQEMPDWAETMLKEQPQPDPVIGLRVA